jgi:uncharacterized protein with ParB-like and HNH nuclease domain
MLILEYRCGLNKTYRYLFHLYLCFVLYNNHFRVDRVIPDSKKESRVNRELLRNCNSVKTEKPDTYQEMKTNAFAI